MAAGGETLNPGGAAKQLGIGSSTLRIYSVRLGDVLSAEAGMPKAGPGGRPGVRRYSADDLRLLARAKELLRRGLTYEQVAAELQPRGGTAGQAGVGGARVRRAGVVRAADVAAMLEPLKAALERATAATEAWQRLAEERQQEVAELRQRVRALEAELSARRSAPSGWSRLFGRG